MLTLHTEIEINAPIEAVWHMLIDFESHASWNPFITSVKGEPIVGKTVVIKVQRNNQRPLTLKPVVKVVEPYKELTWLSGVGLSNCIFAMNHRYQLIATSPTTTRFINSEEYGGMFSSIIMTPANFENTREGFIAMNEALKAQFPM